jgi:NADH:ubiquinone oxidoreductase subunit K
MSLSLEHFLGAAVLLFGIGVYGLLQRRSLIAMLIALELMLAAVSLAAMALTTFAGNDTAVGLVIALVIAGVAAAETAIALSLFVVIQRSTHSIDVEHLSELQG